MRSQGFIQTAIDVRRDSRRSNPARYTKFFDAARTFAPKSDRLRSSMHFPGQQTSGGDGRSALGTILHGLATQPSIAFALKPLLVFGIDRYDVRARLESHLE